MPLTAKYATTCGACGAPIRPGEEITDTGSGRSKRWAHATCPQGRLDLGDDGQPTTNGQPSAAAAPLALSVWTDGACSGNPGPGGWAWATEDGRQASGGRTRTTNQRMEIQAAREAVRALPGPLVVRSDSTYIVNCFRDGWGKGGLARGWVTSAKKPVVSRDRWEPLVTRVGEHENV